MSHFTSLYYRICNFGQTDPPDNSLATVTQEPSKCRFRLDNDTSGTFVLPDGRKLGYAQYGSPNGKVIFYVHGLPGSRIEAAAFEGICANLNARVIAVERPGFGWSSPQPGRRILDHPKDIEHLAQHLELQEYAVLGISGGGPYALACAVSLPSDKLKAVSIVCGLGLPDMGTKGMRLYNWLGFNVVWPYFPTLAKFWFKRDPGARLNLTDEQRLKLMKSQMLKSKHEKDLAIAHDDDILRLSLRGAREIYAQGFDALIQDGNLAATDFGFKVEDIMPDLPIQLWYGKFDVFVPANHGEQIAQRLGNNAHLHVEDETHYSLYTNCREKFLGDLVAAM